MSGQKSMIIIDALVLGEPLKESGTRARMVACVDSSKLEVPMSVHLERFWEVMPVKHPEILFEPDASEFGKMMKYLCSGRRKAVTNMAEQEFLSHWFGRDGRWHALPPEFNFQLHHVFLSSQWWPPAGQERPSKYYQMLHDTPIIRNWHFLSLIHI